jgi:hypothetical protein
MKVRWSGLGWLCPVDETHKMMYWIPATYDGILSGYYYCAHADHSPVHGVREYTKNIWREAEIEALRIAIDSEEEKE